MVGIGNSALDGVNAQGYGITILGQSNVGLSIVALSNFDRAINAQTESGTRGTIGIWAYGVSGTGNTTGARLFSAVMSLYNYTLQATTAYSKVGSIVINSDGTIA